MRSFLSALVSPVIAFFVSVSPAIAAPVFETVVPFGLRAGSPGNGRLCAGPDGWFWGRTAALGLHGAGTVYRVKPDGSDFRIMTSAPADVRSDNWEPMDLTYDGDGFLWGIIPWNNTPTNPAGVLFKVNAFTGEWTTVWKFGFPGTADNGRYPRGRLVSDRAGYLWGLTTGGGATGDYGTIFKVHTRSGELTMMARFTGAGGEHPGGMPEGPLTDDGAGSFWGTTQHYGYSIFAHHGSVFSINRSTGVMTTLFVFSGGNDGSGPNSVSYAGGRFLLGDLPRRGRCRKGNGLQGECRYRCIHQRVFIFR